MVAVILHLNPKALARGNALNVTILLVTFKADMNTFLISSDRKIWRHCLFVSNRLFWQESSLTRIQQRACLCATLSALDRVTLLYCCTVLSEFATVSDLWRSFFKQIMV